MGVPKIKFRDKEFLLVHGAITTKELYENFLPSLAHLYDDGFIRRFGLVIGTKDDIEYTGEYYDEFGDETDDDSLLGKFKELLK